ncbi:ATP-dependent helicase/nuclease subunit A [Clostridium tetanomorphum]|uniref:helicase-exonuclease AddAB subunit AddA n=1 Tax=Clostridium tetanomorphum TaxID=1553 RepID=UPI000446A3FE|nr:helicase-exonuclease AddAB subunit AddA [Clostridium tetanomorphum]KAJ48972.1 ATP-dependent nuclease subunit A [Clostridium tetanomorphum DSM 665]KAJ49763.1 ATP-dependent nuclease subunit A [Clostridium tetanomorphum DSM 665]MBP1866353.1 ATP-dependent helicase/nuclease subunit A [Clostridium tetanomorphum]NRS83247.1 ATP-dependent helicase/nuclease subunit A [Clostridium tetanomorphum]
MADMKWTQEQQNAICTKNCNLLVAAAAGSGKTAVLVQRIIEKIMDINNPIDIDRLLVVTFTNAAASEMKERIGEAISKELDKNPNFKILQRQLTLLNRANITTIHSFCLQVIRNNFHIIDIDPSFRVGDGTETILLKKEALDELFEQRYEEKNCKKEFLELVDSYGGRDDAKILEMVESIYNFSQSLPWPQMWFDKVLQSFNVDSDFKFEESNWANIIIEDIKIEIVGLKKKILRALKSLKETEGLESYVEVFKEDLITIEKIESSLCWQDLNSEIKNFNFGNLPRKRVDDSIKEIKDKALDIRKKVKEKIEKIKDDVFVGTENIGENLRKLYPRIKCLIELTMDFSKIYRSKKREKNIVDFNDIEHFALEILTDFNENKEVIPSAVAIEYREKFEEVLVDEYQDSNLVQEVILNCVSRQPNIKLENQKLIQPNRFMVGDVKQSIYRFRQAKPELFLDKYNNYSEQEGDNNRKIKLFKNFRSRKEVIDGVNFIFKQIMCKNIGELDYDEEEKLNQGANFPELDEEINCGGSIEINLMEKNKVDSNNSSYEEYDNYIFSEEEEQPDNIQLEASMVSQIIKNLVNGENDNSFMVLDKATSKYRKIQYRDIVILMRATAEAAPIFMEELNNRGIPVFADTASGYFQTTEVKTILSLLQIVDNPRQDIPLLSVMRSPIFSFSSEEVIDVKLINKNMSIYEDLRKIEDEGLCTEDEKNYVKNLNKDLIKKVIGFLNKLNSWREKSLHMGIDQFIWYLYTETGYYGYAGAMPGGIQRQANLRILFERAKQYESTSFRGLFNFIDFINKLKNSSGDMGSAKVLGENENVVRIMSIHKSKGLEFPVVILSTTGKNFNLQDIRKSMLYHHELGLGPDYVDLEKRISYPTIIKQIIKKKIKLETLSEEMRILYVAFTRAKEKLIITGMINNLDNTLEKWASIAMEGEEKIPEYALMESKNYLDWIFPTVLRHKDSVDFADKFDIKDMEQRIILDESKWKIKLWDRDELIEDKVEKEEIDILKELENLQFSTEESKYKEEIKRRLKWEYKYIESCTIPAKFSVSELKRKFSETDDENSTPLLVTSLLKKPIFLEKTKKFTSAQIGTFMHLAMQQININKTSSIEEIRNEISRMIIEEFITEEAAREVRINKIYNFFKSTLGKRVKAASHIKRETPFYIEVNSTDIYKDLSKDIYGGEKVILQGVIDLYFEEEDGLVLIDYKTDYVEDIEDIKKKYFMQLKYYKEALERITGKKVKEKFLYLFHIDDFIEI